MEELTSEERIARHRNRRLSKQANNKNRFRPRKIFLILIIFVSLTTILLFIAQREIKKANERKPLLAERQQLEVLLSIVNKFHTQSDLVKETSILDLPQSLSRLEDTMREIKELKIKELKTDYFPENNDGAMLKELCRPGNVKQKFVRNMETIVDNLKFLMNSDSDIKERISRNIISLQSGSLMSKVTYIELICISGIDTKINLINKGTSTNP